MTRIWISALTALLVGCGSAFAQISPGSPLGMTSPLGIGPGSAVAPTGIPLGATELASPGVSPTTSGASPLGLAASTPCSGIGGSIPQASFGTTTSTTSTTSGTDSSTMGTSSASTSVSNSVFDGGGTVGTASGTCATTSGSALAGPATSASSPTGMGSVASVGRVGIPLGSTELGAGGVSPPSVALTLNPTAPVTPLGSTVPCSTNSMSSTTGTLSTTGTTTTGTSTSSGSC